VAAVADPHGKVAALLTGLRFQPEVYRFVKNVYIQLNLNGLNVTGGQPGFAEIAAFAISGDHD